VLLVQAFPEQDTESSQVLSVQISQKPPKLQTVSKVTKTEHLYALHASMNGLTEPLDGGDTVSGAYSIIPVKCARIISGGENGAQVMRDTPLL